MHDPKLPSKRLIPFARGWHVIDEIDLAPLVWNHAATERLCARLEVLADLLPERPAADAIDELCAGLQLRVRDHVERENSLLAAMFAREMPDTLYHTVIDRIHVWYVACTVQAQDLIFALKAPTGGPGKPCPETLGYMLRGFFDGCRAAMAFEELAILALAEKRLTPGARALLTDRLAGA